MPCGNSSNINVSKTFVEVNPAAYSSSRFIVTIPSSSYAVGITGGDVIYYDVATTTYKKAKADDAITSEVFGVVEARNSISGSIDVVTQGSINFPSTGFTATSGGGGAGGLDVYFLSDTDAGKIQPLAPTEVGHIVKPVYQVGSHGGSYTGLVTNYIGYNIGTEVETTVGGFSSGLGSLVFTHGTIDDPSYVNLSNTNFLPVQGNEDLFDIIKGAYGFVYSIKLKKSTDNTPITYASSAILGQAPANKLGASWVGYYENGKQISPLDEEDISISPTTIYEQYRISIFGANGTDPALSGDPEDQRIYNSTWNPFYTQSSNTKRDSRLVGIFNSEAGTYNQGFIVDILKNENIYDETVWYFSTAAEGRGVNSTETSSINVGVPSGPGVTKNGLSSTTSNNYRFIIDTWGNSIGYPSDGYNIVLAEPAKIVGFFLPKITFYSSITDGNGYDQLTIADEYGKFVKGTFNQFTLPLKVYMKVKDTGMSSYLPRSVSIEDTLTVPTLKYGESEEDLETKINSIISRLQTVENRLRIIP